MTVIHEKARAAVTTLPDRETDIGGLCSNCIRLRTCSFVSPVNDTWFCEEYEVERGEPTLSAERPAERLEGKNSERTGLCVNCAQSSECAFPKPPGGVWFCAEYE